MLVLESLDQYLEYSIRPPETLPEWRAQYDERQAQIAKDKAKEKADAATELYWRIGGSKDLYEGRTAEDWEALAWRRLGLVRPGEIVFLFPQE